MEIPYDQSEAMKVQTEIIDNLFSELSKYMTPSELDGHTCIKEINEAAGLRKCLDRAR